MALTKFDKTNVDSSGTHYTEWLNNNMEELNKPLTEEKQKQILSAASASVIAKLRNEW